MKKIAVIVFSGVFTFVMVVQNYITNEPPVEAQTTMMPKIDKQVKEKEKELEEQLQKTDDMLDKVPTPKKVRTVVKHVPPPKETVYFRINGCLYEREIERIDGHLVIEAAEICDLQETNAKPQKRTRKRRTKKADVQQGINLDSNTQKLTQ